MTSALLSSRYSRTNEQEALIFELFGPSDRVGVVGVTTINDDVTLFEKGNELLDEGVDGSTSLDKEDDFSWPLELGNEFLDGVSTLNIGAYKAKRPLIRS